MTKPTSGLGLGMFMAALVASAILAASSGAAKHADTITCTAAVTTLTWVSGTAGVDYAWVDGTGNPVGQGHTNITSNRPDSTQVTTPSNAAMASATFIPRHGPGLRLAPVTCTP